MTTPNSNDNRPSTSGKELADRLRGFAGQMKDRDLGVWAFNKTEMWEIIAALEAPAQDIGQARTELVALRLNLAADLGNIKSPAVSRTKKEILEETIERIEVVLAILSQSVAKGTEKETMAK